MARFSAQDVIDQLLWKDSGDENSSDSDEDSIFDYDAIRVSNYNTKTEYYFFRKSFL